MEAFSAAGQATDDSTIQSMRFACWITKVRDPHLEYAIVLVFFTLQKWLHERASMLCLYLHCVSGLCLFCRQNYKERSTTLTAALQNTNLSPKTLKFSPAAVRHKPQPKHSNSLLPQSDTNLSPNILILSCRSQTQTSTQTL